MTSVVHIMCGGPDDTEYRLNAVVIPNLPCDILTPLGRQELPFPAIQRGQAPRVVEHAQGSFVVRDSVRLHIWLDGTGTSDTRDFYIPIHEAGVIPALPQQQQDCPIHMIIGRDCVLDWDAYDGQNAPILSIGLARKTPAEK
ncbi:hypothetical protein P170DRAFT_438087 [Aspergillus steynii IBT 23096]|uniref:Uncharacterized protein n=1 Tax=Aspergillus steynii IBT 23096 TaxID=1392250 RepID=A0A2I2G6H2_9EURO|nr:uncharacterized protein P170DRAFT_438087 [Aspergillus steynii IBT 23096]PLB48470.1 hypothetical protein P170DRAFT_438087 [Aspergillus steynii IBT 23096]